MCKKSKFLKLPFVSLLKKDEGLSTMEDRTHAKKDGKDDNRVQDMEEGSSEEETEEGSSSAQPAIQPPLPPIPDKVVVKKYDPKNGTVHASNLKINIIFHKYTEITTDEYINATSGINKKR